jgi:hypothetical protein
MNPSHSGGMYGSTSIYALESNKLIQITGFRVAILGYAKSSSHELIILQSSQEISLKIKEHNKRNLNMTDIDVTIPLVTLHLDNDYILPALFQFIAIISRSTAVNNINEAIDVYLIGNRIYFVYIYIYLFYIYFILFIGNNNKDDVALRTIHWLQSENKKLDNDSKPSNNEIDYNEVIQLIKQYHVNKDNKIIESSQSQPAIDSRSVRFSTINATSDIIIEDESDDDFPSTDEDADEEDDADDYADDLSFHDAINKKSSSGVLKKSNNKQSHYKFEESCYG